jgi:sugar lactone lactonase YvrE
VFSQGRLVVADAYLGIYRIDSKGKSSQILVPGDKEVDGKTDKIINGLTIAKDGSIYYTSSSTRYSANIDLKYILLNFSLWRLCGSSRSRHTRKSKKVTQ